jgi:hypothetical protein
VRRGISQDLEWSEQQGMDVNYKEGKGGSIPVDITEQQAAL